MQFQDITKAWNNRNLNHKWNGITYYYTKMPHIFPKGASFFITFNLYGAIPANVVEQIRVNRDLELKKLMSQDQLDFNTAKNLANKRFFANIDKYLDEGHESPHWLKQDEVAKIVKDRILDIETWGWYKVACYCIMSNHVHLLIDTAIENPDDDNIQPIEKCMQFLKGQTARFANQFLNRTGDFFWQKDYYNRYIRDEKEYQNVVFYILNNPIKAKIIETWEAYPHTFISQNLLKEYGL